MSLDTVGGVAALFAVQTSVLLIVGLVLSAAVRRHASRAHAVLLGAIVACAAAAPLGVAARATNIGLFAPGSRGVAGDAEAPGATPIVSEVPRLPGEDTSAAGPAARASVRAATAEDRAPVAPTGGWNLPPGTLALWIWGGLSVAMAGRLGWAAGRGRLLVKRASVVTLELQACGDAVAARLGWRRRVEVRSSHEASAPAIWCWARRPVLLVPVGWGGAGCDREAVLAHEIAHAARRDHLAALCAELLVCCLPWNPLAYVVRRRLAMLAEEACDDWALSVGGSPVSYAETLLAMTPSARGRLALAAVSRGSALGQRVKRILGPRRRTSPGAGVGFACVCAGLALGAAALSASARQRQPEPAKAAARGRAEGPRGDLGARLAALDGEDWRSAFALGQESVRLPAEEAWAVIRENWGKVSSVEARQQILKAWAFAGDGRNEAAERHLLDVLGLGVRDASPKVQEWAINYLRAIAFQDFALDIGAYEAWRAKYSGATLEEARRGSCRAWVEGLKSMKAEDFRAQSDQLREASVAFRQSPGARQEAVKSGAVGALMPWIKRAAEGDATLERPAQEALGILGELELDHATVQREIVPLMGESVPEGVRAAAIRAIGAKGNTWAVPLLLDYVKKCAAAADLSRCRSGLWAAAQALGELGDPSVIPTLIAVIDTRTEYDTVYGIGYFGLGRLTGVRYDESHDGAWWREWWEKNKSRFAEPVRRQSIPELPKHAASPGGGSSAADPLADVADVPVQDLTVGGDSNKRFFLIGPRKDAVAPEKGYRLVLVLPGGDGSAEFSPFIRRVFKNAAAGDCVFAELVAPKWSDREDRVVWPTAGLKDPAMKFSTEEFIGAVVREVGGRIRIDRSRIDALGWSSGGPPVYAAAVQRDLPIRGAFVAMSVFKPEMLASLEGAAGRRVYVLHSPQDSISMSFPQSAVEKLGGAGATVKFASYEGGHGWHGDVFGEIRAGLEWVDSGR